MAQPASIRLDLSTLRSDGNDQGPSKTGYTKLTSQDEDHRNYLKELTKKFNANPQLVAAYGPHQFVGDIPNGFTLWTHTTKGGSVIEEVYGNSRGLYRSAVGFTIHIGELLAANNARDAQIRAQVAAQDLVDAYNAVIDHNRVKVDEFPITGILPPFKNPDDSDVLEYARTIGFVARDVDAAVLADRRNNPAVRIPNCACTLR